MISLVNTPPWVSIPRLKGVTSSNNTSLRSPPSTAPCKAAPAATASSGLTSRRGARPNSFSTASCTRGMRVWPPTNITSSMSEGLTPASCMAWRHGSRLFSTKSSTKLSNLARVSLIFMCLGPVASAVTYGKFTSVCVLFESSIFVRSAASLRRCRAIGSLVRSTPDSFLNSAIR